MSEDVLFQMWGPFRQSLIHGHVFYVDQTRKRLLSQFDDISAESDKAAEDWLAQHSKHFDPDQDDPCDFYEHANNAGIEFYLLLSDMQDQTRLSVLAGMFHEWDKQLRQWLAREIQHWHVDREAVEKVWSVDFVKIADLLESLGWQLRQTDYFDKLDACRLVVNAYKHGEGKSFECFKKHHSEYLDYPMKGEGKPLFGLDTLDHTHVKVSDDQLQAFSDAIVKF